MQDLNSQFILNMLIIALGYTGKRTGIVKEKDGEGLARIIFNFTLPALVINIISKSKIDYSLIWLPAINIAFGILMALIALLVFRKETHKRRGMLSMVLPGLNVALFAFPLVEALWGEEALKYIAMFDMGSTVVIFGICYLLASCFSFDGSAVDFKSMAVRVLRSFPFLALMVTLAVYLAGFHFPGIIIEISGVLAKANMPLSLLLLGIYLNFSFESGYLSGMAKVIAIRYLAGIAAGAGLYLVLPFDTLFRSTILLGFVLPIASSSIPYSVQFGYDRKFIATLTNITIIASFVLIWVSSIVFKTGR